MKRIAAFILCLLLTACAGTPFKWSEARQIKAGMTTQEVTAIMGAPFRVVSNGGTIQYTWSFANGMTGQSKAVRVDFKDGKAISAPPIPDEFKD